MALMRYPDEVTHRLSARRHEPLSRNCSCCSASPPRTADCMVTRAAKQSHSNINTSKKPKRMLCCALAVCLPCQVKKMVKVLARVALLLLLIAAARVDASCNSRICLESAPGTYQGLLFMQLQYHHSSSSLTVHGTPHEHACASMVTVQARWWHVHRHACEAWQSERHADSSIVVCKHTIFWSSQLSQSCQL